MHLSEGHQSDMLLDLSGLTREECVMVQASINNERDFDKVADALINQTKNSLLLKITVTTTAKSKQQMRIEHVTMQLTLEARSAKKSRTARTIRNTTCFFIFNSG